MALSCQIKNMSFSYPGSYQTLFQNLNLELQSGWTAVVGENGAGKSTFLKILCSIITPEKGNLIFKGLKFYCPQSADVLPNETSDFFECYDHERYVIQDKLGIQEDWPKRWTSLSWGERKRIQLAVALWKNPDLLALDEPTNHLDLETRNLILKTLKNFKGIGLIVSHDRAFLDDLCESTFSLINRELVIRKGGYSQSIKQKQSEEEFLKDQYDKLNKEKKKLHKEMARRRQEASLSHQKRSKKGLALHDHDSRFKKNLARITGKDGQDGKLLNQLRGRFEHMESKIQNIKVAKKHKSGISIQSETSKKQVFFFSKSFNLNLGKDRQLILPEISIRRENRIAITGPNGTGKTTLLMHIYKNLSLKHDQVLYIPQEIHPEKLQDIKKQFQNLNNHEKGIILSEIQRLGSSPESFMDSLELSPGEIKKLLFSFGFKNKVPFIIMDEPTNHLDIDSIECLESALETTQCALLFVTHDQRFLSQISEEHWKIIIDNEDSKLCL